MQKPYRIIHEIIVLLWSNQQASLALDRVGNAIVSRGGDRNDGRPHPPKHRTIDLRAGDKVMLGGAWHLIRGVVCARDQWLTEEEAGALAGDEGFVYRPRKPR